MDLCLKSLLLVKSMAAPPDRNRQLDSIMDRSLPEYQFGVRDSEVTTMAYEFLYDLNILLTTSTDIKLALHPIPLRLNTFISSLILYRLTIREARDGEVESMETLTTRRSI